MKKNIVRTLALTALALAILGGVARAQTIGPMVSGVTVNGAQQSALAYPYTNDSTTGTTLNSLAEVNSANHAILASTTLTTPAWIVAQGAGTSGTAELTATGYAPCTMDATNASFGSYPVYIIKSATTAGDCHAQTTAPAAGTWVVGFLGVGVSSTTSGSTSYVSVGAPFGGFFMPVASGNSGSLSSVSAAIAANSIQNTSFGQTWQWNALSSTNLFGLDLSETTASASGNPNLLNVVTAASSDTTAVNITCGANPTNACFNVSVGGTRFYIDPNATPNFSGAMECDNGSGTPLSCSFIEGSNADWLFRDSSNSIHAVVLANVTGDQGVGVTYTNNSAGTTNFLLACLTGAGQVTTCAASATSGVIGVVQEGASTSGTARLLTHLGDIATCTFDGGITQGDYVQTGSTAGKCHDTGSTTRPASNEVIGRIVSATNASAGNYLVQLTLEGQ